MLSSLTYSRRKAGNTKQMILPVFHLHWEIQFDLTKEWNLIPI